MERISAFMDGESSPAETHQAVLRLKQDAECQQMWSAFHLIGDVMRGDPLVDDGFMARFHARMENEPTQLAPRRLAWRKVKDIGLGVAASVCAVAITGTIAYSLMQKNQELAQAPTPQPTIPATQGERPRPAPSLAQTQGKVNEYLMAHQEYSPSTALQGVALYVRTVSEVHDGNNR